MTLEDLLALQTLDGLEPAKALRVIGTLVDHALDTRDLELNSRVLHWAAKLEPRLTDDTERVLLDYYWANAWANVDADARQDRTQAWVWDQEPAQRQLLLLRRALTRPTFPKVPDLLQCQILTNLGNQLSYLGRFIEAREFWSRALDAMPDFWMARFNRGFGLITYARHLYDMGHRAVLALAAHTDMVNAVSSLDAHAEYGDVRLRAEFVAYAQSIAARVDLEAVSAEYNPDGFSLGEDAREQGYRKWCLQECLFLNPLNDAGPNSIAARDVMQLPTFCTLADERPVVLGLFNQLKQEFVSARWMYYEGVTSEGLHFSDRDVALYNTLDYPALGLAAEKVKLAFRMSYSLFDKIAFFLNHYMKLGIAETQVSFRHVWRDKKTKLLRPAFADTENLAFRALYWLSRDFYDEDIKDSMEPEARACHDLRNHLEHKYLKLHLMALPEPETTPSPFDLFKDDLAHSLTVADLERRSLRMLKLARAALIYLLLGMHTEEERRRAASGSDGLAATMPIHMADDLYKQRLG
ncbi:hypothetical protein KAK06_18120 [Ideonella sp. 4Y11]|uniref:LA2681-like HEPN domain-containing protein n=1 Tax=Ideonella aquatica TaxID=2824119 RepID=A0A940YQ24_9BURK|nr:LA2681 family HEPN domain-containing protein [Ideonella aquatica]MBQ0960877.1 hypothetical protein [Ideonella aquatica]